jgi:uncharacterized protein DUF4337
MQPAGQHARPFPPGLRFHFQENSLEAHETHERIEEAGHGHHGTKRIAILITALAALLAIAEMAGKSAQNAYTASNIEASNLWAFFQAKTIRATTLRTAAELLAASQGQPAERGQAAEKQIAQWRAAAERYDSEPATQEGRKELSARAKAAEAKRDHMLSTYHMFEYSSAAFQLAIVLASAAVVTGAIALAFLAGGLGLVGVGLGLLGWLAPTLIHF